MQTESINNGSRCFFILNISDNKLAMHTSNQPPPFSPSPLLSLAVLAAIM